MIMDEALNIHVLPTYTAEKYYLLSELHNLSVSFVFLGEQDVSTQSLAVAEGAVTRAIAPLRPPHCFYYILWDLRRTDSATMIERLRPIFEYSRRQPWAAPPGRCMLAVETLTTDRHWRTNGDEGAIAQVYQWIKTSGAVGHVVFGLADHISGTAALEAVFDCIRGTRDKASPGRILIVAESENDLLGHDVSREPDAESGVTQALLYSVPDNAWMLKKDANRLCHELHTDDVKPYIQGAVVIAVAIIAIVYYYYMMK